MSDKEQKNKTIFNRLKSKMNVTPRPFPIETADLTFSKLGKINIHDIHDKYFN
jgi:hypothetical protein